MLHYIVYLQILFYKKKLVQKYVSFEQNKSKSLISQPSKEEITNVICTFCPSDFVEDTAEHKRERRKHGLISF